MLKRNVYVLYPAGFSGSYLRWAISRADVDLRHSTPENPLNSSSSEKLGGAGTAHGYIRIPTHQAFMQHMMWVAANRPTDKRVYLINVAGDDANAKRGSPEFAASMLLRHDPEAAIINIHDNNDILVAAYGTINCTLKWPTYLAIAFFNRGIKHIDPFDTNNTEFRNHAVLDTALFHRGRPMNMASVQKSIDDELGWYSIRGELQPHEVNAETYPHLEKLKTVNIKDRIFELSCKDIPGDSFPRLLEQIMVDADISTDHQLQYVQDFHANYTAAQQHLQWFHSIENWELTGELDEYLMSHAIIQAQVIKLILRRTKSTWPREVLNVVLNWQNYSLKEINDAYQRTN